jgi:hypothetical protein
LQDQGVFVGETSSTILYQQFWKVPMSSLLKTASWVVVRKKDNHAMFETYDENLIFHVNKSLYKVVPILEYLQQLNKENKQWTFQSAIIKA